MKLGWEHAAVSAGLLLFGIGYNWLVTTLEKSGHDQGYTSILVVGGVIVTIAASTPLIGLDAVVSLTLLFVASGTPMIVGSLLRYAREREQIDAMNRQRALENLDGNAS